MAYTKTNWTNGTAPAINATNLNKIEQGIKDNSDNIDTNAAALQSFIDSLYFAPGDEYTHDNGGILPCPALITASTKAVYFTIVLPKRLDNITSFTVDALVGSVRSTAGYVDGTGDSTNLLTNYTAETLIADSQTVRIVLTKASALTNASNNHVAVVGLRSFKFTFA